jgi:hypothetical protein
MGMLREVTVGLKMGGERDVSTCGRRANEFVGLMRLIFRI